MDWEDIGFRGNDKDPNEFTITEEGLGEIANWCRFHLELGRLSPSFSFEENGDLTYELKIAFLVWFILVEAYNKRGLNAPGVKRGDLFPEDWDV